jgi:hypothetical protein
VRKFGVYATHTTVVRFDIQENENVVEALNERVDTKYLKTLVSV